MSTTTENKYVSNGSTVLYSFTFPYINESDVKVSLNGLNTTEYTLANATTVELNTAPNSGVSIRIFRSTPTDEISAEFFPGSAIRAQDLNANFEQSLYVVQESQAIIENSDAASVTAIANEALSTANQASNIANAVSGTANTALTTANEAETTANQALSDASTANDAANAARVIADAALNPGSVISDLSDVSNVAPASNQVLAWSGSQWSPVDQTGEGGGGGTGTPTNTNIYGTAKAWGSVDVNGAKRFGTNFTSQVISPGIFEITFNSPLSSTDYVVATAPSDNNASIGVINVDNSSRTTSSFRITTGYYTGSFTAYSYDFDFTVHDNEPAEVALTTFGDVINYSGAAAWGDFESSGALTASLNASVAFITTGQYQVTFTTPLPSANYVVTTGGPASIVQTSGKTANGFVYNTADASGAATNYGGSFAAHALNALPPKGGTGTDAWGTFNASGVIGSSFNIASVNRSTTGVYEVTFTTPMPTASYAVNATASDTSSRATVYDAEITPTGFKIYVVDSSGLSNNSCSFSVNATNATLPTTFTAAQIQSVLDFVAVANPAGVAKAWGSIDGATGNTIGSLNATSSRISTGVYQVTFNTPLPNANYAPVISTDQAIVAFVQGSILNTGFQISTFNVAGLPVDGFVSFTVHSN